MENYKAIIEKELFDRVLPFWMEHSLDSKNGGYYNCLDEDGSVYDTTKHVWLQGRQTWMLAKLYGHYGLGGEVLEAAKLGLRFLENFAIQDNGRAYFSMTKDGKPIYMQRKMFSESFSVMALAEMSRVLGDDSLMKRAKLMFEQIWTWTEDFSVLGRPVLSGQRKSRTLAVPMILLNLIEELCGPDQKMWEDYKPQIDKCIGDSLLHYQRDSKLVYENVGMKGEILSGSEGRILNPGHAIEAGWFLLHWAKYRGDEELKQDAISIIRQSHDRGWDDKYGGLYYFLDAEGYSPTQLEWSMKLWWPHTEALYAHLLAYKTTGEDEDLVRFKQVQEYAWKHFVDDKRGGWYGYCDRRGELSHRFKGGPYKGFFHVPRALHLCLGAL